MTPTRRSILLGATALLATRAVALAAPAPEITIVADGVVLRTLPVALGDRPAPFDLTEAKPYTTRIDSSVLPLHATAEEMPNTLGPAEGRIVQLRPDGTTYVENSQRGTYRVGWRGQILVQDGDVRFQAIHTRVAAMDRFAAETVQGWEVPQLAQRAWQDVVPARRGDITLAEANGERLVLRLP